jgi:Fungal specific transcription factor domain
MLGLNKDPSHFPALSPVAAEIRRRLAWAVYYQDVTIAMQAGLPPLIDDASWDVGLVSEAKDELIGTEGLAGYETEVSAGTRQRAFADPVDSEDQSSPVSTAGIWASGKFRAVGEISCHLLEIESDLCQYTLSTS